MKPSVGKSLNLWLDATRTGIHDLPHSSWNCRDSDRMIIGFLLPGQKFISTLLSDILTILGIIWACKVFLLLLSCPISLIMSQQTQSDILHTKMLQNVLWCQITWSKCMLCNILEYTETIKIYEEKFVVLKKIQ
jgi:hypothetical protein